MHAKSRMLVLLLVVSLVVGLLAAGCGPGVEKDEPVATGPREGGVLVIANSGDPVSVNPIFQRDWVSRQGIIYMYDSLLYLDENEDIQPALATDWGVSDDGLTWVFDLRDDVLFHDGTRFDAEAVKFNYDIRLDADSGARDYATLSAYMDSVEVLGDFKVQFNLKRVEVHLLEEMTWSGLMVSPAAYVEYGEEFASAAVGTGPFKFKSYEPDSHLELVRFDDYWGGRPPLDGVTVRIIPEASARIIELEAGNVDLSYYVDAKDIDRLVRAGINVEDRTTASYQMASVNLEKEPTTELAVRKAIALAIDRDTIIDQVLYGRAEKSRAGLPSTSPYYHGDVPMFEYDPDEAGRLLDEAGWVKGSDGIRRRDGKALELTVLTTDAEIRVLISQVMQEQLSQIGFDAKVVTMEWGAYLDAMRAGDFNISYWSLASTAHRSSTGTANLKSDAHWNVSQIRHQPGLAEVSARVDDIIDTVSVTIDPETRFGMMREFQVLTQEHVLNIWLWHIQAHFAVQPWVKDYELYHYSQFWIQNVWLDR